MFQLRQGRWKVLDGLRHRSLPIQSKTVLACGVLHNILEARREEYEVKTTSLVVNAFSFIKGKLNRNRWLILRVLELSGITANMNMCHFSLFDSQKNKKPLYKDTVSPTSA